LSRVPHAFPVPGERALTPTLITRYMRVAADVRVPLNALGG